MTSTKRRKLIRILVYEGTDDFLRGGLEHREVKGLWVCPNGTIKEVFPNGFAQKVSMSLMWLLAKLTGTFRRVR